MEDLIFFEKHGYPLNFKYKKQIDDTEMWEGKLIFDENSTDTFKTLSLHLFEKIEPFNFSGMSLNKSTYKNSPIKRLNFVKTNFPNQQIDSIELYDSNSYSYLKVVTGKNIQLKYPLGTIITFTGVETVYDTNYDTAYVNNKFFKVIKVEKDKIFVNINRNNSIYEEFIVTNALISDVSYIETTDSLQNYFNIKNSLYNDGYYRRRSSINISQQISQLQIPKDITVSGGSYVKFYMRFNGIDTEYRYDYNVDFNIIFNQFKTDVTPYLNGMGVEFYAVENGINLDLNFVYNEKSNDGGLVVNYTDIFFEVYDEFGSILNTYYHLGASIPQTIFYRTILYNVDSIASNSALVRNENNFNYKKYIFYGVSGNINIKINGTVYSETFDTDQQTTLSNWIENNKHLFDFNLIDYEYNYENRIYDYGLIIYVDSTEDYLIETDGTFNYLQLYNFLGGNDETRSVSNFYKDRLEVFKLDLLPVPSGNLNFIINNEEYNIPFNTDESTTLNDFITEYNLINYGNILNSTYYATHPNPDRVGMNITIDGLDDLFNLNSYSGGDIGDLTLKTISEGNQGTFIESVYVDTVDIPVYDFHDVVTGMRVIIKELLTSNLKNNLGSYIITGFNATRIFLSSERFNTPISSFSEEIIFETLEYITDLREGVSGEQYQLLVEMEDQRNEDFILYDVTGEQLQDNGDLTYIGVKPLYGEDGELPVYLNYEDNKDINEIKNPFKQRTVFKQLKFNMLTNDDEIDNFLFPISTSVHIAFKSVNEGVSENYLLIKKWKDLKINIVTDESNQDNTLIFNSDGVINLNNINLIREISSGKLGKIVTSGTPTSTVKFFDDLTNSIIDNSLFETVDFISLGLKKGMDILISGYDNVNLTNQEIFLNNNKTFNIIEVTPTKIVTNVKYSTMKSQSSYILKENPLDLLTPIPTGFNITFQTVPNTIGKIHLMGQSEEEDVRLKNMSKLFNCLIDDKDIFIFKEYDINEAGMDWIYLNAKRKEMLLEYNNIFNFIGSYKAPVNAIKYFGYNDLILKEYFLNVEKSKGNYKVYHPVTINDYLAGETARIDSIERNLPSKKFKKSNLFNLTYKITDFYGNNILEYSNDEILIKLFGLKKLLRRKFLPITAKIIDITGEASVEEIIRDTTFLNTHTVIESNTDMSVVDYDCSAYFSGYNNAYIINIDFKSLYPDNINYYTLLMKIYAPEAKNILENKSLVESVVFDNQTSYSDIIITYTNEEGYASFINLNIGDMIRIEHSAGNNGVYKITNKIENATLFQYTLSVDKLLLDEFYDSVLLEDLRIVKISSDIDDNQYNEVSVIKEIFVDGLTSYQHVVDGVENPLIEIEVTTENNYGGMYCIRRTITPSYNFIN